jgi:hypothetical protein
MEIIKMGYDHLGCDTVYFGIWVPTFRRILLPLSSGYKSELSGGKSMWYMEWRTRNGTTR